MADDSNDRNRDPQAGATGSDSEEALRDELQRESKEAKGGIGDIAEDRNLSGSSSWLTDPPQPKNGGSADEDRSRK
jgi:hypothetical protein